MSACEKSGQWQAALHLSDLQPAAASGSRAQCRASASLRLPCLSSFRSQAADVVSFSAAISRWTLEYCFCFCDPTVSVCSAKLRGIQYSPGAEVPWDKVTFGQLRSSCWIACCSSTSATFNHSSCCSHRMLP